MKEEGLLKGIEGKEQLYTMTIFIGGLKSKNAPVMLLLWNCSAVASIPKRLGPFKYFLEL